MKGTGSMRGRKSRRYIGIGILSIMILVCTGACGIWENTEAPVVEERTSVHWEQRSELSYDYDMIMDMIDEFVLLVEDSESDIFTETARRMYEQLVEQVDRAATVYAINEINYYKDIDNEEYARRQEVLEEEVMEIMDAFYLALQQMANGPYQEFFTEILGEDIVEGLMEYEELSEQEKELTRQETALVQEYDQAVRVEYPSQQEMNVVIAPIYQELIAIRQERAAIAGYDNYAEYIYEERYMRDYSLADVKRLFKIIKKDVPAIYGNVLSGSAMWGYTEALGELGDSTAAGRMDLIEPYLAEISPDLEEAFQYMREYGLYDMDHERGKAEVGFTIELPYYNDAFIFDSPYGYYEDYATLIHEFGHYYNFYQSKEPYIFSASNVDVAEIHSQGLEMLFLEYSTDMFGQETGDAYQFMEIFKYLDNIIMCAAIAEFEVLVYESPEITIEEMNQLFESLLEEYGYDRFGWSLTEYDWVDIAHIFQSPGYVIGYVTSALSALDLLSVAQYNQEEAAAMYMELTAAPSYIGYCEAVADAGMRDIFQPGVVSEIMEDTLLSLEDGKAGITNTAAVEKELLIIFVTIYVISVLAVVLTAIIAIIVVLAIRAKAKKE